MLSSNTVLLPEPQAAVRPREIGKSAMTQKIFFACSILAVVFLAGCSSTKIDSDWDRDVDFSKYSTFAWYDHTGEERQPQQANPIVDIRIRRSVAEDLLAKGLQQTAPDKADLLVTYFTNVDRQLRMYNTGWGYGGWGYGYWGGWGMGQTHVYEYAEGTLVIDFVDNRKNQLVWRGMLTKALSKSDTSESRITKAVTGILQKFPPQQK